MSHKARKNDKFFTFKGLTKFLKLRIKNKDKTTDNYAKRYIKKKSKSCVAHIEDFDNSISSLSSRCKFYKKKYRSNECYHPEAKCHYFQVVGHITKFSQKKSFIRTSPPKEIIIYTQDISFLVVNQLSYILPMSYTVTTQYQKSSDKKVIINSRAIDYYFTNREYFSF